ncbi:MAG: 3-methyl-2-oxobutanoate dehydrogenase subunit beta, partial [Bacteroidales bacterium]|nr:3-methyl-2-oxobutanoate dehydrogenase subunit beta [Bacteroidales bacterium]
QMMEKVYLKPQKERSTELLPWATTGKPETRERNIITSLDLDSARQEKFNLKLVAKYNEIKEKEVRFEEFETDDAEYILVAYGTSARICQKAIKLSRAEGIKVGLLRPITLFPYPGRRLNELASQVKGMLAVEMSTGQMVEDVMLSVNGKTRVAHFGRMGGIIPTPEEVVENLKNFIKG